ncbi:tetratricopeptide repeat protein [Marispirochaeta sp.]|uniref:tetratricopeptide repeat protein n=1 Tax=Marispirochaeta sp. TaxID=2038653 RepID=UPI0029C7751F|nr:tetratricopeptide repeat protein [Marispirochaeta sp.]
MSEKLHLLVNQGADLLSLNNPEEAERCFAQVLEIDPAHLLALFNSAIALSRMDKFKPAEERLIRFLELRSDDPEAWNQLGYIRFQSGNSGEAAKAYARAEELNPKDATIQNNIGALNFVQGRYEKALTCFEKALGIDKNHRDALFNIADTCEVLGRLQEAQAYRRRLNELKTI